VARTLVHSDASEPVEASMEVTADSAEAQERQLARIVIRAAEGDRVAWESLVERFGGLIWAITRGYRLGHSDAEDVCQATWLRLVEHLHRIRKPERVGAWLATTARRECLQALRNSERQVPMGDSTDIEPYVAEAINASSVEDRVIASDEAATLWQAFERIPERWQLLLRVLMSDPSPTYEDVAKVLSMPIGSIGPTRARCLEHLRRNIELAYTSANPKRAGRKSGIPGSFLSAKSA
jgi:RNA polymerase sigma factor (sigma-70 family)